MTSHTACPTIISSAPSTVGPPRRISVGVNAPGIAAVRFAREQVVHESQVGARAREPAQRVEARRIGMHAFVPDEGVRLYGFEAGGDGVETGRHAASITGGSSGVLHGARAAGAGRPVGSVYRLDDGRLVYVTK